MAEVELRVPIGALDGKVGVAAGAAHELEAAPTAPVLDDEPEVLPIVAGDSHLLQGVAQGGGSLGAFTRTQVPSAGKGPGRGGRGAVWGGGRGVRG